MALVNTSFSYDITVDLSDLVINGTTIKRKATLVEMVFSPKTQSVKLVVTVEPFAYRADTPDHYGDSLADKQGFTTWTRYIVADMNSLVRATDGSLVLDSNGDNVGMEVFSQIDTSPAGIAAAHAQGLSFVLVDPFAPGGILYDNVANAPMDVMKEYDFYNNVAHVAPVVIGDMIRSKMVAAIY